MPDATIPERIDAIVAEALREFTVRTYTRPKVIHDAVHGSHVFEPHEVALLDLPLIQRLRRIRQLGLVLHVYPAGAHSRFEHSLGVYVMASRLVDALGSRHSGLFTPTQRFEIRIAALLHDIGHMPFSHITEEVVDDPERLRGVVDLKRASPTTDKIHEIFGASMIRSRAFRTKFVQPYLESYPVLDGVDFDRIADLIVGKAPDDLLDFEARIISGVLDADKMDYILRDCHMTGLRMSVDIDRVLQTVTVVQPAGTARRSLAIDLNGVSTVEQLLFDKLLLNMAVYHHQKVRATECGLKGLYELLFERRGRVGAGTLDDPLALLRLSDDDILVLDHSDDPDLARLARRLTQRDLLMRSATISRRCVDEDRSAPGAYLAFLSLADDPARTRLLREQLAGELGADVHEVWIDVPRQPKLREASNFWVDAHAGTPIKLDDVFSITQWLRAFDDVKYRAHVFLPAPLQRVATYEVVKRFFERELGLVVSEEARMASRY